ncbi:MAG: hypothetical protein AAF490_12030 [Chloroflexota bacterium]
MLKNPNMGRFIGIALLVGGVLVGIIIVVLMNTYRSEGSLTAGAATLGMAVGLIVLVLPQLAFGAFFLWQGGQDTAVAADAAQSRKVLDMVKARGQIHISDLVIETNSTREKVHDIIYQLVGMGLYSGYINWEEGILYSREANELRELKNCYNCTGELELAGKGVVKCPWCGTEYFLE